MERNDIHSRLRGFVASERDRFSDEHNNSFALAFSEIDRYSAFIEIILSRYTEATHSYTPHTDALTASVLPASNPLTSDQLATLNHSTEANDLLQLEIESFYLFAKIMLDKVARVIAFYFGQARGLALDSHDNLTQRF